MTPEANGRVWEALIKVGTALAWVCAGALIMHEVRLSAIEANRYTPQDALMFERATSLRFEDLERDLRGTLNKMDTKIEVAITILEELRREQQKGKE